MKVMDWEEFCSFRPPKPRSVAIGVFDGVHLGHRKLIEAVRSKEPGAESAAVTFRENPKRILRPQSYRGSISSLPLKLEWLEATGLQTCVLIDFSSDFGTLSGASFLGLLAAAGVGFISVGPNFRCGHRMDTNAQRLLELASGLGMEAEIVEPLSYAGHPVSSSRIRNEVLDGRLDKAAAMLGRPFVLEIEGGWSLRPGGGWTAMPAPQALLPPEGEYLVGLGAGPGAERLRAFLKDGMVVVGAGKAPGACRLAFLDRVSRE